MFCSIQEAWPEYYNKNNLYNVNNVVENTLSDNYNKLNNRSIGENPFIKKQNIIEKFSEEKFNEENETIKEFNGECEKIFLHLQNCDKCRNKLNLMENNRSIINKLNNLTEESKETIIIFLIGFVIILLIHLFYK